MPALPESTHRRDIDGLRAVAVLPVILFHAGLPAFAGGYLGVDIFFVISGFLITGILARDLHRGRFSLARFYERRARRILPALTLVLLACLVPALAWLSPNELRLFAQSFLATALSVSNILFWQQLDYFGPDADRLPLLHTWSLGIEEQFYLLFPPLLALLWHRHLARPVILALLAASLVLALWLHPRAPSATFFLLPTRAWELLAGAALALAPRVPASGPAAAAGLAAIAAAMAAVPLGLLPSILPILLACAGSLLVIGCARPGTQAARLLSHPVPVGIGLVSYSAYLWHQPLLAFARIRLGPLDPGPAIALGALAIVLAWPTWAFVERPFRRPGAAGPARPLLAAAATLALLAALGLAGIVTNGLEMRVSPAVREIMASVRDTNPYRATCKTGFDQPNPAHPVTGCLLDGTGPGVAFWGDSHADALQGAMFAAARDAGFRFYSVTRSACPPAPGLTRTGAAASPDCDAFNRGIEAYAADAGFPVVVLAARWISGAAPEPFDNGEGGAENPHDDWLTPIGATPRDTAERETLVIARYVAAVENLLDRGFRVVLVYPIPETGWNVPEELARRRAASDTPVTLTTPKAAFDARQAPILAAFDAVDNPHLYRARPAETLCDSPDHPGRCLNSLGDQPLYFDENHLNNVGASLVVPQVMQAIEAARRDTGPGRVPLNGG